MKTLIILSAFLLLFKISNAQEPVRRFEFGSTLLTVNSFNTNYYFPPERPSVEYINGLFFRYTKNRFSLRAHMSYSDNSTAFATPANWTDGSSGDIRTKDLRIGIGGQISILKEKEWFYTFLDLSYRNAFSTGHKYGGIRGANDQFSRTANGFDSFLGLGFKIKTLKNIFLSPELGFLTSGTIANETSTSLNSGNKVKYNYADVNINPTLKLHLTVKF